MLLVFGLYATVDSVKCSCKTATLRFNMYNCMDQDSIGIFAHFFPNSAQARQYMWWNWTEDHNWGGLHRLVVVVLAAVVYGGN